MSPLYQYEPYLVVFGGGPAEEKGDWLVEKTNEVS
jgi:hypothetical protein